MLRPAGGMSREGLSIKASHDLKSKPGSTLRCGRGLLLSSREQPGHISERRRLARLRKGGQDARTPCFAAETLALRNLRTMFRPFPLWMAGILPAFVLAGGTPARRVLSQREGPSTGLGCLFPPGVSDRIASGFGGRREGRCTPISRAGQGALRGRGRGGIDRVPRVTMFAAGP